MVALQERPVMAGLPHLQYPRLMQHQRMQMPANNNMLMQMPQPLLQRLPASLNSHSQANLSLPLPAPPRLQPIPSKHQYPPHTSVKQMYK